MDIVRDQRALLLVANLAKDIDAYAVLAGNGSPSPVGLALDREKLWQALYQWLDLNAIGAEKLILGNQYHTIEELTGAGVTVDAFIDRIQWLADLPGTQVLDVVLVMHGGPNVLCFDDRNVNTAVLGEQIKELGLKHKLRLLYSNACYGSTHAEYFVKAGFRTASGAKCVCANGPYDLPVQLTTWAAGGTYRSAVKAGNYPPCRKVYDSAARLLGLPDVDSEKIIAGKKLTRITSPAE